MSLGTLERDSFSDWQDAMLEITRLEKELAELRAQRDELRGACAAALAQVETHTDNMSESVYEKSPWRPVWEQLRAALAQCEKGQS